MSDRRGLRRPGKRACAVIGGQRERERGGGEREGGRERQGERGEKGRETDRERK